MIRSASALALAVLVAAVAQAHFVFVVPAKGGANVTVVFSDDLSPDEAVDIGKIADLKLTVRDAAGKDQPVAHSKDKHSLSAAVPGSGPRLVFGTIHYGVMQKDGTKPYLLAYHPKAVLGAVAGDQLTVGTALPCELIPVVETGKVRFKLLASGKPVPDAEVTVIKPDGSKVKAKTNAEGLTDAVEGSGQFGVWARHFEPKAGELAGKKYEEVRHYATLVVDVAK